jgi:hypothetical protein
MFKVLIMLQWEHAIDCRRNLFVMDNTMDGFSLHQLDNGAHIHTF